MSSNARSHEQKNRFMKDTANLYGFSGKKWDVFLNRFSKEREGQAHNTIADSLWTEEVVDPRQTFQDHLKSICDQFIEKGCPGIDSKNRPRGRPSVKESPWRIAYKWLWDTKFPEWQEKDTQSTAVETVRPKWQKVCREMLEQGKRLTINELMAKDGIRVNPDELFVPIGLVERRQKRYRRFDVDSAEQGSSLLKPEQEEIVQRFDNLEAFFDQAISDPDIPMGYRMVITGHPGGGKTSLLQKLGDRLHQKSMYPIWISLAKISAKSLREYLFDDWLREAAGSALAVPSDWQADLDSLIKTGKVWLLLDGADEIASDSPLGHMRSVFQEEWAKQVQVVLTCRLSAWDTNSLSDFKVYRTLEFDYHTPVKEVLQEYPNQVEAFIHKFFARPDANPQSGRDLIQQLYAPSKERIRDSVKNPLRLTLLCYVWETGLGSLPDTKAELYRLFVDYYYDLQVLKHPETRIDRTVRDSLNRKLGEVAKAALDSRDSRFCLRKSLITSIGGFGEPDTKDSLFWKALQLNWLNYIGTTAEKPFEDAYTFFHSTFQEYFAALAIDDWHFFLNHIPHNPHLGKYKIFKPLWKEVILLWLGRQDIGKALKDELILTLKDFSDSCGGHYWLQSFSLAAEGLTEFKSEYTTQIVMKLVYWACHIDIDFLYVWVLAQKTIRLTDKERAIQELIRLINKTKHNAVKAYAIELLEELDVSKVEFYRVSSLNNELISFCKEGYFFKIGYRGFSDILVNHEEEEARQLFFEKKSLFFERKLSSLGLRDVIQNSELDADYKILSLINEIHINKTNKKSDLIIVFDFLISKLIDSINLSTLSKVVSTLKNLLNLDHLSGNYNALLWSCAQNMSYPEFYEAWHSPLANGSEFDAVGDEGL